MYILGISAFYHDSAASIIYRGKIIAAVQEERFTRKKHDQSFPFYSIKYCLEEAGISSSQIENIVFYEKPFLKFERLIETYLAFVPKGFRNFTVSMPLWIKDKLFQKNKLINELSNCLNLDKNILKKKLIFSEHHLSHAASAFYPSPFKNSIILTLDGVGEWVTTSLAIGRGKHLKILKEIKFPHSLGLLYSAFTYYLGFKVNSGEYKVMGLAPYGKPKYIDIIKNKLIKIIEDGSFQINMSYFDFATGTNMTNKKFNLLFGGTPRVPESKITQREMDLAASIQKVTEEIITKLCQSISKETNEKNLCIAGGVGLNCVVNGILLKKKIFNKIWIQPASGDAGGSLGAALSAWHLFHNNDRIVNHNRDSMNGSYLGPKFNDTQIEHELQSCGAIFKKISEENLINYIVNDLTNEKAIGWMHGRMEFGPRALGGRSIIADPRSSNIQQQLNLKIKFRETFRPFAPSILFEDLEEWFEINQESPYMLFVADVKKDKRVDPKKREEQLYGLDKLKLIRSKVPAITHVDNSARIQTVHKETNPRFYKLIKKFKEKTGVPILVNTSFNVRGEPIVCTPTDAFKCFMKTHLDTLVIENYLMIKEDQKKRKS